MHNYFQIKSSCSQSRTRVLRRSECHQQSDGNVCYDHKAQSLSCNTPLNSVSPRSLQSTILRYILRSTELRQSENHERTFWSFLHGQYLTKDFIGEQLP